MRGRWLTGDGIERNLFKTFARTGRAMGAHNLLN
jgi:hypothetical protein